MIPIFLGCDFIMEMVSVSKDIAVYIKGIIAVLFVLYTIVKILKTNKDNIALRNNIMASAILLAEDEAKRE